MFKASSKLLALLLALWLPLFSGNALAVAVAMQAGSGGCPVIVQQDGHGMHHEAAMQHQPAAGHDHSAMQQDEHAPCANPDICHLACTGYLAAAVFEVMEPFSPHRPFGDVAVSFRSVSSTPLVPPPLARA